MNNMGVSYDIARKREVIEEENHGKSEKRKSPSTKDERQRARRVDLRLPSKSPDVDVERYNVKVDLSKVNLPATTLPQRVPLPSKPPDAVRVVALLPPPQPPDPPDTGSQGVTPPQSPAANFLPGGDQVRLITIDREKVPERVRVKEESNGKLSNTSVIHVFSLSGELIASLNLIMGHIEKKFTIWAEEIMREKAQFSKVEFWKLVQEQSDAGTILSDAGMSLVVKPVYSKLFYNVFKCVSNDMVAHPARMDTMTIQETNEERLNLVMDPQQSWKLIRKTNEDFDYSRGNTTPVLGHIKENFIIQESLGKDKSIQVDYEKVRNYKKDVVIKYFLSDDRYELFPSLEDIGCTLRHQPIIVKKFITPTMRSKNRKKDIAPPFAFLRTFFSMKDAVNGFIMLLDFMEETSLDILIIDWYNELSYVQRLKFEMLTAVANESNTYEMVTTMCGYAANVDIPIAKESIQVVGKMALQLNDVNFVVPLLQFHEEEKGCATSQGLMFPTIGLNSSVMVIPWDPGKFNSFMTRVTYQCCLSNSLSIYSLLNLVYDRGKIWLKSIWVLLMLVYDRGKDWSLSIWVQMMFGLSSFNGLIPMFFSSELKGLLAARRVIETSTLRTRLI
jgi:hypothetical protein